DVQLAVQRMDDRVRVRAADRRAARPTDTPRPHPRNERRQLSPQAKQATTAPDVIRPPVSLLRCSLGEGPVLAMLPRLRVAPLLPPPPRRAVRAVRPGRDGKAGSLIELKSCVWRDAV